MEVRLGKVYRRNDTRKKWWCTFQWQGRQYREAAGDTKLEAEEYLRQAEARVRGGDLVPDHRKAAFTFGDMFKDWLEGPKAVRKKTRRADVYRLGVLEGILGTKQPAATLTSEGVDKLQAQLLARQTRNKRPMSQAEVNRYMSVLRSAVRLAVKRGKLQRNPMAEFEMAEESPRSRLISPAEFKRLVDASTGDLRLAILLARETAARQSELINATWEAIDLEQRTLRLTADETKAATARIVPLTTDAVALLSSLPHRTGRVFSVTPNVISQRFRKLADSVNLSDVRFHDIRRLGTTELLRAGIPVPIVQKVTGHLTASVLTRHYAALDFGDALAAVDAAAAKRKGAK